MTILEQFDKDAADYKIYFHYYLIYIELKIFKNITFNVMTFEEFRKVRTIDYGTHDCTFSPLSEHKWRFKL